MEKFVTLMQMHHFKESGPTNCHMYRSLPLLAVFALVLFLPAFLSAQDKIDDFDEALSLWDQAHKLGDPASGNFLPDSAYSTILLSQR